MTDRTTFSGKPLLQSVTERETLARVRPFPTVLSPIFDRSFFERLESEWPRLWLGHLWVDELQHCATCEQFIGFEFDYDLICPSLSS